MQASQASSGDDLEVELENVERPERIEEEDWKVREGDMRIEYFIEAYSALKASDLAVLKAGEVLALKYDVMRVCTGSQLVLRLHLPKLRGDDDLF